MHISSTSRSQACDHARSLASLRLDDELSELEETLLETHLRVCAGCRAFAAETAATTRQLRAAPLVRLEHPIALPLTHRRAYLRSVQSAAAGAVAAAAVVAALVGITPAATERAGEERHARASVAEPVSPQRELQLLERIGGRPAPPASEQTGGSDLPL